MKGETPRDILTSHFLCLDTVGYHEVGVTLQLAENLLADPQAHVDALVAAGVLRSLPRSWDGQPTYEVVQPEPPHEHSWRVTAADRQLSRVLVECADPYCNRGGWVPDRLAIEVPDA